MRPRTFRAFVLNRYKNARINFYRDYFGTGKKGYYIQAGKWGVPISPVCPKPCIAWAEAGRHIINQTDQKSIPQQRSL
jgi:hypothetical protein